MHKESYSCIFPDTNTPDTTSTITIPIEEYSKLVKDKATVDALVSMLHNKKKYYEGLTREEVALLDKLYFGGDEE